MIDDVHSGVMTGDQRRRIDKILGRQAESLRALDQSDDAFDRVVAEMRSVLDALQVANDAQREAIQAVLAAHEEAERLRTSDTH